LLSASRRVTCRHSPPSISLSSPHREPPVDFVTGINDIGQIAGWVQGMGFIYTSGAYTTFSVGSGPIQVTGDINNLEQVVGYSHGSGPGGDQGFLYSSGTITRVNDPLAGIFGTDPSGINDSGQIVGTYYGPAAGAPVRGFLYDSGTYADVVDPLTASAGGTHASGINNSGQIVGYYYDGSEVAHGFSITEATTPPSTSRWPLAEPTLPPSTTLARSLATTRTRAGNTDSYITMEPSRPSTIPPVSVWPR
jgi:hypothetical protein